MPKLYDNFVYVMFWWLIKLTVMIVLKLFMDVGRGAVLLSVVSNVAWHWVLC